MRQDITPKYLSHTSTPVCWGRVWGDVFVVEFDVSGQVLFIAVLHPPIMSITELRIIANSGVRMMTNK